MSSLLNVGARALLANQVALSTTGHNIANASTVGYSRQTAVLQQVPGQYTGSGYIGKGVEVQTIERSHNEFLTRQAALAQSVQAMDATRADRLVSLEDIFQGGTSGLGAAVNDMLNALLRRGQHADRHDRAQRGDHARRRDGRALPRRAGPARRPAIRRERSSSAIRSRRINSAGARARRAERTDRSRAGRRPAARTTCSTSATR